MQLHKSLKQTNNEIMIELCEYMIRQYVKILDAKKIELINITFVADGEIYHLNESNLPIVLRNDIRQIVYDCQRECENLIQELKSEL